MSGGGYAMIGTVISADMDRVAQMQPNNLAHFVEVDMATALKARAEYKGRKARLFRTAFGKNVSAATGKFSAARSLSIRTAAALTPSSG